jgi:hypothetical protein
MDLTFIAPFVVFSVGAKNSVWAASGSDLEGRE